MGAQTRGMLCCAVLCCAVLCCAVLCCAVLCCAVLCCAVLRCAALRCAVLCCVLQMLCVVGHRLLHVICPLSAAWLSHHVLHTWLHL
jgi:hypothetical protein